MQIQKAFVDHKKGSTWDGAEMVITETDENGTVSPKNLTGVTILAQFKLNNNVVFEMKTNDNSIVVPEPTNGAFQFVPRLINYAANTYYFDVVLTLLDGTKEIIPTHSWTIYK